MPGQSSGLSHIFPCTAGCTTTNPSFGWPLRGFSTSGSGSEGSHQTPPHLPRLHYRSPRGRKHPARVATAAQANPKAGHPGVQARISVAPAGRSISREEQRRRPQASRCRLRSTRRTALYYSTLRIRRVDSRAATRPGHPAAPGCAGGMRRQARTLRCTVGELAPARSIF
jgi:hypothetical protein